MSKNLAGLPHGWQLVRLGDYSLKTNQKDPTKQSDKTFIYIDVSSVSNKSFRITNYKEIQGKDAPSRARKIIRANDAIFATVRPTLKRIALIPEVLDNQICSTGFCVIRANQTYLDSGFIYYFLLSEYVANRVDNLQKGATYPAISDSDLYDLEIPLMSLEEQRAIATTLRTIQTAKEARQKELALERERKAALMDYLFTHGTRNESPKQTELGEIPESWRLAKIEEVFETQLGKMLSQKSKTGISYKKYLRNANVKWGYIDCSEIFEMDFNEQEMQKFKLKTGDILMCEGGEIGRTAIWRDELAECYFQKTIHRLRPRSRDIVTEFFFFWIERAFRFGNIYGVTGTATTIAHFPQEKLRVAKIPLPEAYLQKEIADILSSCDVKIATLEREINLHDELFRAMLEELMTGQLSSLPLA